MTLSAWDYEKPDDAAVKSLMDETGYPRFLARLLVSRKMATKAACEAFFTSGTDLPDPFLIKDMDKAVERINRAGQEGELICVFGDYDCDGITAAVLLSSYFESAGARCALYIPERREEGYGMNNAAVDEIKHMGASLIVTVDNGISAHAEIEYASSLGIDTVITDHHQVQGGLPPAAAVVNPHRKDDKSPFRHYAGVGLAFMLVCAMEGGETDELLDYYAPIVALGTVADVVPLLGENRKLVQYGLENFAHCGNAGLLALCASAGKDPASLSARDMSFSIAPRINAVSRVGDVNLALSLLKTEDEEAAAEICARIEEYNQERHEAENAIAEDIIQQIADRPDQLNQRILIFAGEGWNPGVIGILASRVAERYNKPCVLISKGAEESTGSARSVEGFSIVDAVASCGNLLVKYGGHTQAAGFTLKTDKLPEFRKQLLQYARDTAYFMPADKIHIDLDIGIDELTVGNIALAKRLEPFGRDNAAPVYLLAKARLEQITPLSGGKHLKLKLGREGKSVSVLLFGVRQNEFAFKSEDVVDVVFGADIGQYKGEEQLSLVVKDIKPHNADNSAILRSGLVYEAAKRGEFEHLTAGDIPDRDDIACVYKAIREKPVTFPEALAYKMNERDISFCKTRFAVDVLEEMGLVRVSFAGGKCGVSVISGAAKVDINDSLILKELAARVS